MVKVNTKDGSTLSFDLTKKSEAHAWKRFVSGRGWSDSITALSVCHGGVNHTLPIPRLKRFKCYDFGAEVAHDSKTGKPVAEKVYFCFNKIRVSYLVYFGQKVTKVEIKDLETIGLGGSDG